MGDPLSVLDKLERIAARASKGPWSWEDLGRNESREPEAATLTLDYVGGSVLYHRAHWKPRKADRAFIALSRTAVPALVRGLRKALAGLEGCDHAQRCGTDPRRTGVCLRCAARESALSELRGMGEE